MGTRLTIDRGSASSPSSSTCVLGELRDDFSSLRTACLSRLVGEKRTPDASARPHPLPTIDSVVVVAVGSVRSTKARFDASCEPAAGKCAERGTDPDQEQRVRARRRYSVVQLASEVRVAERVESDRRRIENRLWLRVVGAPRIADEGSGDLINRSRRAVSVPPDQHQAADAEFNVTGAQIHQRRSRAGDRRKRAGTDLTDYFAVLVLD